MPWIVINHDRCKGCELCIAACPKKVIEMACDINRSGYFYAKVAHPDLCSGCRLCAISCPDTGIEVYGKRGKGSK